MRKGPGGALQLDRTDLPTGERADLKYWDADDFARKIGARQKPSGQHEDRILVIRPDQTTVASLSDVEFRALFGVSRDARRPNPPKPSALPQGRPDRSETRYGY